MNIDLNELEALARAATPGEWQHKKFGVIHGGPMIRFANGSAQGQIAMFCGTFNEQHPAEPERQIANADFASAANPAAVLELIAIARQAPPAIPAQPGIDTVAIPLVSGEELLARAAQQVQPPPPPVKRWQDRYNHGVGSPAKIECMRLEIEDWRALLATPAPVAGVQPFQQRVQPWMMACFGAEISADKKERNHRFFEESTELVQAQGMTASEAHQLVDYVYGRPVGEPAQEVGGVMVTLAALCLAQGMDMHAAGETELARIWTKVEAIRAKQAAKPKHSPLPQAVQPDVGRDTALVNLIKRTIERLTRAQIFPLASEWRTALAAHPSADVTRVGELSDAGITASLPPILLSDVGGGVCTTGHHSVQIIMSNVEVIKAYVESANTILAAAKKG